MPKLAGKEVYCCGVGRSQQQTPAFVGQPHAREERVGLWGATSKSYRTCSSHPSKMLAGDTSLEFERYTREHGTLVCATCRPLVPLGFGRLLEHVRLDSHPRFVARNLGMAAS